MEGLFNHVIDGETYLGFITTITLLMFIVIMRSFNRRLRNKFTAVAVAMLIALTAGALDTHFGYVGCCTNIRYLFKIVKYICEGYMELTVVQIVGHDYRKSRLKILWTPFILISIVIASAPFSPAVFSFGPKGEFIRGPVGYIVFVQAGIYTLMALAVCAKKWFNGYQRDALIILFMLAVVSMGVFLEEALIYDNCTLTSSSIGVLFVYVYMYAERYNVDSVSGCYKRRCFYSDAAKYAKTNMAVISMDLNDLKLINDNFGHKAGDIALLTLAEVCRSVKDNRFILYRTGGDEFMMLGIKASKEEAEQLISDTKQKLSETPYSCSFGLHMYKPGDDFDEVVVQADKAMYDDKSLYKQSRTKRSHARTEQYDEKSQSFNNDIKFKN
ncbi:diguanylate cyclase (GGDEF) domain-containing protein [Pseudobutyrivibrio sp. YE44]|uniref:GGDEF domain-containing protein n=1 Tax=Pseudobutyrivibrio sp. YE44 TaxID=1520802 RepID=UPI000884546A|nr:GGDEF domain-containing protein [Pseudobutyrivibrio sp. YE44]SDB25602.1 diguanylate cyclase (GGDEF) domain-containing protein [Pseudobutyrivibrio sp. YE44]